MKTLVRVFATLLVLLAIVGAAIVSFVPVAGAQAEVVGSADFRNAPQLPPGQYLDRIVTGDTAWYAVIYTNNTPYEFEVLFQGQDPGSAVDLTVSFVAPTLATIDGPSSLVSGNGVEYPAGHTNVWFLKVSLATTGQAGVEYPVQIFVNGVQTAGIEDCADIADCALDDEYAAVNVALAEAQAEVEIFRAQETTAAVEAEIENLKGFAESSDTFAPAAEARLAQAEATMADLCAPEPMCDEFPDPGSKTPILGWAVGLAALALGLYRAVKRFGKDPDAEEVKPQRRQPSSLDRAQAESKARSRAKSKK